MKNLYYAVFVSLLTISLAAGNVKAQGFTPVGLHADHVAMPALAELKMAYLAPAYVSLEMATKNFEADPTASLVSTKVEEGEQTIGGGLAYGSEIERLGIQLSYFYFMTAAIALGGDLTFFFPQKDSFFDTTVTQNFITLNVMMHYVVFTTIIFRAYVLAGLNYALFRDKVKNSVGSETFSSSELGLNLGGGIENALSAGLLFLELKYIVSAFDQLVLAVGYRHKLGN